MVSALNRHPHASRNPLSFPGRLASSPQRLARAHAIRCSKQHPIVFDSKQTYEAVFRVMRVAEAANQQLMALQGKLSQELDQKNPWQQFTLFLMKQFQAYGLGLAKVIKAGEQQKSQAEYFLDMLTGLKLYGCITVLQTQMRSLPASISDTWQDLNLDSVGDFEGKRHFEPFQFRICRRDPQRIRASLVTLFDRIGYYHEAIIVRARTHRNIQLQDFTPLDFMAQLFREIAEFIQETATYPQLLQTPDFQFAGWLKKMQGSFILEYAERNPT